MKVCGLPETHTYIQKPPRTRLCQIQITTGLIGRKVLRKGSQSLWSEQRKYRGRRKLDISDTHYITQCLLQRLEHCELVHFGWRVSKQAYKRQINHSIHHTATVLTPQTEGEDHCTKKV